MLLRSVDDMENLPSDLGLVARVTHLSKHYGIDGA